MQYIRAKELAKILSISRVTLWRWANSGHLPKPVHIGPRTVLWSVDEINNWLMAARDEHGKDC